MSKPGEMDKMLKENNVRFMLDETEKTIKRF